MLEQWWILVGVVVVAVYALVQRSLRRAWEESRFVQAKRHFHIQRERLEAKFVKLASANARSNSPHWADCDFDDDVAYVRNRNTGELSAFVAVTVAMERVKETPSSIGDLIGNLHAGTAVFRFDGDHWETDGRAILNLSPAEAIRFYRNDYEMVDQEIAERG